MFFSTRIVRRDERGAQNKSGVPSRGGAAGCRVECLEPRFLFNTVTWANAAGGAWNASDNWNPKSIPKPGDSVIINLSGNVQVTLSTTVSINDLTLTGDTLVVQATGSLTTTAGVVNSGAIIVNTGCRMTVGGNYSQSSAGTLSLPGGGSTTDPTSNQLADSDFESPVLANSTTTPAGWSAWGSSYLGNTYAYAGAQSLQTSGPNSGALQSFNVTHGASYTLSADAMTPSTDPLTGSEAAYLLLIFFDPNGIQISSYSAPNSVMVLSTSSGSGGPLAGSVGGEGWNHFSTTAMAPVNAVTADAIVEVGDYNGSGAGGGAVYWDSPQFGPAVAGPSKVSAATITNNGFITVGPGNTLAATGAFTQTSTATLDVQLGGAPATGDFGFVQAGGQATLDGTLESQIINGYVPATTDIFTPIEFAGETGGFADDQLSGGTGYQFQGAVTFTNVVLSAVPTSPLTVTVNASSVLHAVNANLLGVNLAYWDSSLGTTQTQQAAEAAGLNAYRFPGGSASDDYHFNTSNNDGDSSANTIAQFVAFVQSAAGTGVVTLDYGSGSPQEAAAELAYLQGSVTDTTSLGTGIEWNDASGAWQSVNWNTVGYWAGLRAASPLATDDGLNFLRINHPAPFTGIRNLEVGNEEYGSWEIDHHGTAAPGGVSTGTQHDPATYVAFMKQFANLASEITATAGLASISIGIDSGDPTGNSDGNWTENVLLACASAGIIPGFVSDHSYMQGPGDESDPFLLNDTVTQAGNVLDWTTRYADYQSLLQQTLGVQGPAVNIMATEFNSVYTDPGKQSTSLVNGLFVAESIGTLLQTGYTGGFVWDLRNGWDTSENNSPSLYGWRMGGDYGILGDPSSNQPPESGPYIPYPSYFAEQLASKMVQAGGQVVSVNSNYQEFQAYAVQEPNGHLELLAINTNPAASLTAQFNIAGFQASSQAQVWQYGESQDTAQSQSGSGTTALSNGIATLNTAGGNFSSSFPAYSMTVIDLAPDGPAVTTVILNGVNGALAGAQRSMVESIVYTFNQAVKIPAVGAFATAIHPGLTGTAPTLSWSPVSANVDGSSMEWVITFGGAGVVGGSIANGIYDITMNSAVITSDANPSLIAIARPTDTFYRLYGDINGDEVVNAADNAKFKTALTVYNPIFDINGDGVVNAADNAQFKKALVINFFGDGFVPTI